MIDDPWLVAILDFPPVAWLIENWGWVTTSAGAVFLWHFKKKVDQGDARRPIRDRLVEHLESTAERTRRMIATIKREKYTFPETRGALTTAKEEFEAMRGDLASLGARDIVAELRKWHTDMFTLVDLIEREDGAVFKILNMGHLVPWMAPQHLDDLEARAKRIDELRIRAERLRLYPWWTWPIRR